MFPATSDFHRRVGSEIWTVPQLGVLDELDQFLGLGFALAISPLSQYRVVQLPSSAQLRQSVGSQVRCPPRQAHQLVLCMSRIQPIGNIFDVRQLNHLDSASVLQEGFRNLHGVFSARPVGVRDDPNRSSFEDLRILPAPFPCSAGVGRCQQSPLSKPVCVRAPPLRHRRALGDSSLFQANR